MQQKIKSIERQLDPSQGIPGQGLETGHKEDALIAALCDNTYSCRILTALDAELARNPQALGLLEEKAQLLRRLGRLSESLKSYKLLLRQKPKDTYLLAMVKILAGAGSQGDGLQLAPEKAFVPAPFYRLRQPLAESEVQALLQHVLIHQKDFVPAGVRNQYRNRIFDSNNRQTAVLHEMGTFKAHFTRLIRSQLPVLQTQFGMPVFSPSQIELKLTNHLDNHFFRTHKDDHQWSEGDKRIISFVFYFHRRPKSFKGGDLLLFDTHAESESYKALQFTRIGCDYNSLVFFPSRFFHCVEPVQLENNRFELGRFAVGGHIRKFSQSKNAS